MRKRELLRKRNRKRPNYDASRKRRNKWRLYPLPGMKNQRRRRRIRMPEMKEVMSNPKSSFKRTRPLTHPSYRIKNGTRPSRYSGNKYKKSGNWSNNARSSRRWKSYIPIGMVVVIDGASRCCRGIPLGNS